MSGPLHGILIDTDGSQHIVRRYLQSGFLRRGAFRLLTGSAAPHFDHAKQWDTANVERLLEDEPRASRILDCGGFNSPSIRALTHRGFRNVHSIDLNPALPAQEVFGSTRLTVQDMQATAFRSGEFDVVLSCSTVEHGVSWSRFLEEAARLLRPGGLLYVSTDLVHDETDPSSVEEFGLPWQPLRIADLPVVIELLGRMGFSAPPAIDIELPATLPYRFHGAALAFIAFIATRLP